MIKKALQSFSKTSDKITRNVALAAMLIMTPVIFVNIVLRFGFGYSLAWSSEVSRYCFIWITFLGTAVALRDNSHARITLLLDRSSPKIRKGLLLLNHLVVIALSALLVWAGAGQVVKVWSTKAASMRFLSMGWMYMAIPICGFLMLVFSLAHIVEVLKKD